MKKKVLMILSSALLAAALFSGCTSAKEVQTTPSATTAAPAPAPAETAVIAAPSDSAGSAQAQAPAAETKAAIETANAPAAAPAQTAEAADQADAVTVRIGAMSGPTAMGLVKLKSDSEEGKTENTYEFLDFATEASAMVTPLSQGTVDIAAVPSNLAATLYNKTNGGIQVLAVNTLGVLNLVERGESINSLSDLAGKKIYATGQAAVPEYVINYLLKQNGLDPEKDVEIQFCADTTEALSYLKEVEGAVAVLPQPFVTAAQAQIEDLRVVSDLNDDWAKVNPDCNIVTGVTVVRTEFAKEHPEVISTFLDEYQGSLVYTGEDPEGCAALIEKYGIIAKAPLAKKALPSCNIVCLVAGDMKESVSGFLQVLFDQNPKAVGGAMPADDFYYFN